MKGAEYWMPLAIEWHYHNLSECIRDEEKMTAAQFLESKGFCAANAQKYSTYLHTYHYQYKKNPYKYDWKVESGSAAIEIAVTPTALPSPLDVSHNFATAEDDDNHKGNEDAVLASISNNSESHLENANRCDETELNANEIGDIFHELKNTEVDASANVDTTGPPATLDTNTHRFDPNASVSQNGAQPRKRHANTSHMLDEVVSQDYLVPREDLLKKLHRYKKKARMLKTQRDDYARQVKSLQREVERLEGNYAETNAADPSKPIREDFI
ncbi:hypothetical protein MPSEU_000551500 [Mayamaea pseudoterrestris]|nr:hypothetical protein MPSEU_000551500 [Mayamaea pseudoterrestris]